MQRITSLLLLLGVAVVLTACPYRQALRQAEEYETLQQWREAVQAYRDALAERPDSEDALAGLDRVTAPAVADALADGRAALSVGGYEDAMYHYQYIVGLTGGDDGSNLLASDVLAAMALDLTFLIGTEQMVAAYELANRTGALFANPAHLPESYATIRAHFYAQSDQLLAEGRYAEALGQLDTILTYEPHMAGEVGTRAQVIRYAWADEVIVGAEQAASDGYRGAAGAQYARAYEIAARDNDLANARAQTVGLLELGYLHFSVEYSGDATRLNALEPITDTHLNSMPGAVRVGEGAGAMSIEITTKGAWCSDESQGLQGQQPYISGYNEYENPVYADLRYRIDQTRGSLSDLEHQYYGVQGRTNEAQQQTNYYEQSVMQPLWNEMNQLRTQMDNLTPQVDGARRMVAEIEASIRDAEQRGVPEEAILASRLLLGTEQQRLTNLENELYLAQNRYNDLERALASAQPEYDRLRSASQYAQAELSSIESDMNYRRQELNNLENQIYSTPPTVTEEIWDTFNYQIWEVTRTCGTEIELAYSGSWEGASSNTIVLSSSWHATDRTNEGFPQYGVQADPLAYSMSDWDMYLASDADTAAQINQTISSLSDHYYATRWGYGDQVRDANPAAAVDYYLQVYLAAPSRINDNGLSTLRSLLATEYGLTNIDLLHPY